MHRSQLVAYAIALGLLVAACQINTEEAQTNTEETLGEVQSAFVSDSARNELRGMVEQVSTSTARRYGATDSAGHAMDTAKIIEDATGGYIAVFHTYVSGVAKVNLATSTNLLNWTWVRELGGSPTSASQADIMLASNGGFVVAWEQEPSNHLLFRYFANRTDLMNGTVTRSYEASRTLSNCAEGTPNIYSITLNPDIDHSTIDVGHHYYANCDKDREARGTLTNFNSWTTSTQPNFDNALLYWNVGGNIGDRDATTYKGYKFGLVEGQGIQFNWASWRSYVYDYQTGNADTMSIVTNGGSTAFGNPTITNLMSPNGKMAILSTMFLFSEGAASGESGTLISYKDYASCDDGLCPSATESAQTCVADCGKLVFDTADARRASTTADWASNVYKSECGRQQSAIGISVSPTTHKAHALLCGTDNTNRKHGAGTGCRKVNFATGDNGVSTDWDSGYYKGQCASNEFVAGVTQVPATGAMSDILCCPGSVTQQSCTTQVVYSGDARELGAAAATGDWDSGYYKGECSPGRYVAGVSRLPSGAPHAIRCCSQ